MRNLIKPKQDGSDRALYSAVYKCPLCGSLFRCGEPKEIPYNEIPRLCAMVVKNQTMIGNPYLYQAPMYLPHQCSNGDGGLAVFAGFHKEVK